MVTLRDPFLIFSPPKISLEWLKLETQHNTEFFYVSVTFPGKELRETRYG